MLNRGERRRRRKETHYLLFCSEESLSLSLVGTHSNGLCESSPYGAPEVQSEERHFRLETVSLCDIWNTLHRLQGIFNCLFHSLCVSLLSNSLHRPSSLVWKVIVFYFCETANHMTVFHSLPLFFYTFLSVSAFSRCGDVCSRSEIECTRWIL